MGEHIKTVDSGGRVRTLRNHDGTKGAGLVMMRRGISIWVCNPHLADMNAIGHMSHCGKLRITHE
jgi:hypothetical protein